MDKRRNQRQRCEIESSFRNLDSPERPGLSETLVNELSEGGIRFRTNKFIPLSNKLFFHINVPKKKPINVRTRLRWITEIPNTGQYEIGASFLELSDEDRMIIQNLLDVSPQAPAGAKTTP